MRFMDRDRLTAQLKRTAAELGFGLAGVAPAVTPSGLANLADWLAAGYAGEMSWLADRAEAYRHPRHVLDAARSLLMLGFHYRTVEPAASQSGRGRLSRYAWGSDYHDAIRQRLAGLADWLRTAAPGAAVRGVVDSAPLLEHEFAALAGLGWIGKHTLLLNTTSGSWFFLAALLTDVELACDAPQAADHCGTCRACLDACPTGAFVAPHVLDARRCISYLTIESRQPIPRELRSSIGDWLFGCDVCQEVCPWNRFAPQSAEHELQPIVGATSLDLAALFELDDVAFRDRFRHTPLWRPKRRGLLRNAAIVLGNQRPPDALPALIRGLDDAEPLVRGACAWAVGRYESDPARAALLARLEAEPDPEVRGEISSALRPNRNRLTRSQRSRCRLTALLQLFRRVRISPRGVGRVPLLEHPHPFAWPADRDKGVAHFAAVRMKLRVLDAELAHLAAAVLGPVKILGQPVVLGDHRALLVDRWRLAARLPGRQGPRLSEDPGVADRAAGRGHAVDSRLANHFQASLGREQIAAAQHDPLAGVAFHFAQELPAAGADVFLRHRAAVDRDCRRSALERAVEDAKELVAALGRVVQPAAHLDRHRHPRRHGVAHPADDLQRRLDLAQQVAAPAAAKHLLHRAAEVDVDHVEAGRHEPRRRGAEIVGIGPHQLPAHGVFFVAGAQVPIGPPPVRDLVDELVEHHLAQRVRGPQPPRDHAHRPIAIARQRRLHHGKVERDVSDSQHGRHFSIRRRLS